MEHGSQVRTQMRSGQHRGDQTPGAGAGAGSTHRRSGETRGDQTLMERGKHTAEAGRPEATRPERRGHQTGRTHRRSGETRGNRPDETSHQQREHAPPKRGDPKQPTPRWGGEHHSRLTAWEHLASNGLKPCIVSYSFILPRKS